jgi:peptidoglycan/LPS O-acetylase OafA/YrhL
MKPGAQSAILEAWKGAEAVPRRVASVPVAGHISEIDGLRAVAILSVLLFHVRGGALGGGFVGVDVFFVISGYLITRILLGDLERGRLSLARFYERRILRIAPALFATLVVTAAVFFLLLPPAMSAELRASLVAAVFSYSNLWFHQTVDYFGNNASNPVLHTWSLAVEEQFYFLFPLVLLLAGRAGLAVPKWLLFGVLALVSLVASGVVVGRDPSAAFYLPWLRAWELLAGSMLAAVDLQRLSAGLRAAMSNLGLALILAACLLYDEGTPFPGYAALLPCLGAAAIIAGARSDSIANVLLRTRFMRWTGKISYSLYLVHWPIASLAAVLFSLNSPKVQAAVVVASFVAAWLSWRYVETPFRGMAGHVAARRVFAVFGLLCLGLPLLFAALQSASTALWQRHPQAVRYAEASHQDLAFFRQGTCFLSPRFPDLGQFAFDQCLTPARDRTNVLLIGDSHAANLATSLAASHPAVHVMQSTSAGCRPALGAPGPAHCRILDFTYREWLPRDGTRVEYVVIAARWEASDIEPLKRTVAYLRGLGKAVVIVGPTPEYFVPVPLILAYEDLRRGGLDRRLMKQDRLRLDVQMRDAFGSEAAYFSPVQNLCDAGNCRLLEGGTPVLFDRDHLTPAGARLALQGFPLP